jgi:hypothetical protein
MRPHGRATVSPRKPQVHGICDRCGFRYLLGDLRWQMQWAGPRLQNLRLLVCETCYDKPQENGLRTIVLPADPLPVMNPRPEFYVGADDPQSQLGFDPANMFMPQSRRGVPRGNMTLGGGLNAAFDASTNKRFEMCANLANSQSSFQNTVGVNWNADPSGITTLLPSTMAPQTYAVGSIAMYAPNDQPFLSTGATGWQFQGSPDALAWTTLGSGTTAGTAGEVLTATVSGGDFQFYRVALQGDGISPIGIAQLVLHVIDGSNPEVGL